MWYNFIFNIKILRDFDIFFRRGRNIIVFFILGVIKERGFDI